MASSSGKPKSQPSHWPHGLVYIDRPVYHSSVSAADRIHLRTQPAGSASRPLPVSASAAQSLVVIKPIVDPDHPARGQYGLFASKKIPPRTRILCYLGEVHADDRPTSDYDLSLLRTQDGVNLGIDASRMGNEARFINDYRGVREKPNASFEEDMFAGESRIMGVWSLSQPIYKGDEILVSYGKSWWRERQAEQEGLEECI